MDLRASIAAILPEQSGPVVRDASTSGKCCTDRLSWQHVPEIVALEVWF